MISVYDLNQTHWAVPEWPNVGDASEDTLYRTVGHFLSEWERIENIFADLFSVMVSDGNQETHVASRAFGTLAAFRGRSDMLEAATEAYCQEQDLPGLQENMTQWLKVYRGLVGRRNEIAHGTVIPYSYLTYIFGEEAAGPERDGFVLVPPEYSTKKRRLSGLPKYVYNSELIEKFVIPLDSLKIEIVSAVAAVTKWPYLRDQDAEGL